MELDDERPDYNYHVFGDLSRLFYSLVPSSRRPAATFAAKEYPWNTERHL